MFVTAGLIAFVLDECRPNKVGVPDLFFASSDPKNVASLPFPLSLALLAGHKGQSADLRD
jgi:hypothetical protein